MPVAELLLALHSFKLAVEICFEVSIQNAFGTKYITEPRRFYVRSASTYSIHPNPIHPYFYIYILL